MPGVWRVAPCPIPVLVVFSFIHVHRLAPRPNSVSRTKSRHAWKSAGLHLAQRITREQRASSSATGGTTRCRSSPCTLRHVRAQHCGGLPRRLRHADRAASMCAGGPPPRTVHGSRGSPLPLRLPPTGNDRASPPLRRPAAACRRSRDAYATPTCGRGQRARFPADVTRLAACADLSRNASPGKLASLAPAAGSRAVHSLRAVTSQISTAIPSNSVCSTLLQSGNNAQWAVGSPSECAATSARATGRRSSYAAARGRMASPRALEPAGVLGSGWRGVVAAAHDPYRRGRTSLAKPAPRRPALPVAVQDVRVPDDEGGDAHPHAGSGCSRQDDGAVQDAPRRGGDHHPDDR